MDPLLLIVIVLVVVAVAGGLGVNSLLWALLVVALVVFLFGHSRRVP